MFEASKNDEIFWTKNPLLGLIPQIGGSPSGIANPALQSFCALSLSLYINVCVCVCVCLSTNGQLRDVHGEKDAKSTIT